MALMFQRLAHNFAKNGYFPTDGETLNRILLALAPCDEGDIRILDPCAGEGVALAECKQHLGASRIHAFGIEYDEERAWHAKTLLDCCIHADLQHCIVGQRSFGLLFLNPPYGDLVADKAQTGDVQKGRSRLEKLFYERTLSLLQFGGILVLIIPFYSLDKELAHWISNHFDRVTVFLAPEQRFKQIVLFGRRQRTDALKSNAAIKMHLEQISSGQLPPELPTCWTEAVYTVPAITHSEVKFVSSRVDAKQLEAEITRHPCLWTHFNQRFNNVALPTRRPLMSLSEWHLALSLAAGQVAGVVTSEDGRAFVIKGDTHKEVQTNISYEEISAGEYAEVTTHLDKFVPVIRAVDMTPSSTTYGQVLTIR